MSGGGTLRLDDSHNFHGTVADFGSPKQTEFLDFVDIPLVSGQTTLSYTSGNIANTSGTLMVSEGGHIANITLLGQ
jgi:hypothetical protein